MTPYNNKNSHVTSPTNHSSPRDSLQVLGGEFAQRCGSIDQTLPTNYVADDVFSSSWNHFTVQSHLPPSRQPTGAFQSALCLPPARQLPVSFDDVISAEYNSNGGRAYATAWSDGPRQLCQYGKNSVSGSRFGAYQMTYNSSSSLTLYPTSCSSWVGAHQQQPGYSTCAEYRMSRHHALSDVTSGQCGWPDACDFDEIMWHGKFVSPLEDL